MSKEFEAEIAKYEDEDNFSVEPDEDGNAYHYEILYTPPEESDYAEGIYHLKCEVLANYPNAMPKITFANSIYHPNIDNEGGICKGYFDGCKTLKQMIDVIDDLLTNPQFDDVLRQDCRDTYNKNPQLFHDIAKQEARKLSGQ